MPQTVAYIEGEQSLKVPDCKDRVREMEHLLSGRLAYFRRIAYRFLEDATDAEDAVQEALLTAYKHLNQFRGESQLSTWITTIVCNCARMQLRRRPRQTYVSLDEPIGEEGECALSGQLAGNNPSPEDDYRSLELRRHLDDAAAQLAPSLRRTFHLRDVQGLSIRETAHALGVSIGTVKAQSSRARARMRRLLSKRRRTKRGDTLPIVSVRSSRKRPQAASDPLEGSIIPVVEGMFKEPSAHLAADHSCGRLAVRDRKDS